MANHWFPKRAPILATSTEANTTPDNNAVKSNTGQGPIQNAPGLSGHGYTTGGQIPGSNIYPGVISQPINPIPINPNYVQPNYPQFSWDPVAEVPADPRMDKLAEQLGVEPSEEIGTNVKGEKGNYSLVDLLVAMAEFMDRFRLCPGCGEPGEIAAGDYLCTSCRA